MLCKKCTHGIDMKTECFIVCEGKCRERYHARCVELSEDDVSVIKKNVIWLCNDCLAAFHEERYQELIECKQESTHSGPEVEIVKEIKSLKVQIANIAALLSGAVTNSSSEESSMKIVSTPLTSPDACSAKRESNSEHGNTNGEWSTKNRHSDNVWHQQEQQSFSSFSLLLSNVDNRVTEDDIDALVSKSLGITDNVNVTKLVPKWKSCEEMDYISFKVVLDEKWKSTALRPSTWPPTLKCREFVNRHRCTWYPSSRPVFSC